MKVYREHWGHGTEDSRTLNMYIERECRKRVITSTQILLDGLFDRAKEIRNRKPYDADIPFRFTLL